MLYMDQQHQNSEINYKAIRKQELEETKSRLIDKMSRYKRMSRVYLFMGCFLIVASVLCYYVFSYSKTVSLILLGYGLMTLFAPSIMSNPEAETKIAQIENEIDLLSLEDTSSEMRAEKLFKYHQLELKKYYDQTLRHSSWIFLTGLLCIVCGFVFIGITLYLIFNTRTIEFNEKILLGVIGTISTLLANFIGAIYLKMYSETVKSLTEFHNRLVITHHLHFGNFLNAKISDQQLREKTLSELILKIVENKVQ